MHPPKAFKEHQDHQRQAQHAYLQKEEAGGHAEHRSTSILPQEVQVPSPGNSDRRVHPAPKKLLDDQKKPVRREEKSIEMYRELLYRYSNPGDRVFEPFAGTAAGAKAALLSNRQWVGCEKDEICYGFARQSLGEWLAGQLLYGELRYTDNQDVHLWPTKVEHDTLRRILKGSGTASSRPDYIPATTTEAGARQIECARFDVKVEKSRIQHPDAGEGLFAGRDFLKNERIATYWGTVGWTSKLNAGCSGRRVFLSDLKNAHDIDITIDGSRQCVASNAYHARSKDPTCNAELVDIVSGTKEERLEYTLMVRGVLGKTKTVDDFLKLPCLCTLVAKRDISPDEEILIDYGTKYWGDEFLKDPSAVTESDEDIGGYDPELSDEDEAEDVVEGATDGES